MFSPLLPPVAQFRNPLFLIRLSSFLTPIVTLNSLSKDPTRRLVPKRHNVEERGDGCGQNVEDSDSDDGDEEEEDSDEDNVKEKEEEEERDTSTEGHSSSQDGSSEKPSEKTSSHVSLTLFQTIVSIPAARWH